jgi:hypothetical protein
VTNNRTEAAHKAEFTATPEFRSRAQNFHGHEMAKGENGNGKEPQ